MRFYDIIKKKRDGNELSTEEINFFVSSYTQGHIPDYQAAAFLMAVYFQKMSKRETADLTMAMMRSGDTMDLSAIEGVKVDKHSTGGVGDKTTLVLGPLVAAAGVPVAKMSGRGLGHTGGTVDKLESISGFHIELSADKFIQNVNDIKLAVVGQSGNLAPADKKLYALRDVTATVDNISLIASSVMSKKLAAGADAIVLDVKVGRGAFMKNEEEAFKLAKEMVDIGSCVERETIAVITDMNEPLGYAVGNALEVKEAVDTLKGKGPKDLEELCLVLGSQMLVAAKKASNPHHAREILQKLIENGEAFNKFKEFVTAQGGDSSIIDFPEKLPQASIQYQIRSEQRGFVQQIEADTIGLAALVLGAGRETKESIIDLSVGVILRKKIGDFVENDEVIAEIHANSEETAKEAEKMILKAYQLTIDTVHRAPLVKGIVTVGGIQHF